MVGLWVCLVLLRTKKAAYTAVYEAVVRARFLVADQCELGAGGHLHPG